MKEPKKKFSDIWNPRYMKRPLIYKIYTKAIIVLLLSMLWYRVVDKGARGVGFVFLVMGIVMLGLAWFAYLALDGVRIGHLMMDWKKDKKNTVHFNKDIADFIDEEVIDFDELDDDEKMLIRLYSNLAVGVGYIVASYVVPIFIH